MTNPTTAPASSFSFDDAELPAVTRGAETAGPNPFADVLKLSAATNKGKAVTVPADQVGAVIRYIRRAANDQNIGARIVLRPVDTKGNVDMKVKLDTETIGGTKTAKGRISGGKTQVTRNGKPYVGAVRVLFQGGKRKARKTTTTPATPAATPAQ